MAIKLKGNVRHNRTLYRAGDIIEKVKKEEAQRLVDLGVAFFVGNIPDSKVEPDDSEENSANLSPLDEEDPATLLDESFSYEELKETAAAVGMEFKGNIGKKGLIALIIEQNKIDLFFEDEE